MSISSVQPDPSMIGGISKAAFVFLPDPSILFARRAMRFRHLSNGHALAGYLGFLADLCDAQATIASALAPMAPLAAETLARAREFAMPPFDRSGFRMDAAASETARRLFDAFDAVPKPDAAQVALTAVKLADEAAFAAMVRSVLGDTIPPDSIAEHVYVAAFLQLHFARLAAGLDAGALVPVAAGVCPVCGGRPASSIIAGWHGAEGARYACCSLCSTLWNEVRVKCLGCESTKGIRYQQIEGKPDTIKAETCDACDGYLKIVYQNKDTSLDPVADDVASLGIDMLMRDGGRYRRIGFSPYLMGY